MNQSGRMEKVRAALSLALDLEALDYNAALAEVEEWEAKEEDWRSAYERALSEADRLKAALTDYTNCADWYRRCLEDVQDRKVVRGLAEAKAGYDSTLAAARAALVPADRNTT